MQTTDKLECIEKNAVVNGIRLTYFERGMAYRGIKPTLLFVHATGFHARVWDKIINSLGDFHSISVDQRGHGRSEKKKIQHWSEVITDTSEMIEQLDLTNVIAIGHSMGGHALIGAAAKAEHRFLRIIAIDPVIPEEAAFADEDTVTIQWCRGTSNRKTPKRIRLTGRNGRTPQTQGIVWCVRSRNVDGLTANMDCCLTKKVRDMSLPAPLPK